MYLRGHPHGNAFVRITNSIATLIAEDFVVHRLYFSTLCKKLLHNVMKCKWHKVA